MNNLVNKCIKRVFSLPTLIFMMAMIAAPIAMTFLFSLDDWSLLMGNGMYFNWGKNCLDVPVSREFWQPLEVTFYHTAITMVAGILLGLVIALVSNKDFWDKSGIKAVVPLLYMMAPVAMGPVQTLLYEPSPGLLNYILITVELPRSALVSAKQIVIPVTVAVETWRMTPMVVIVCLAGLSSLSTDPMEAARVSGAAPIQIFLQVALPLLTQTLFPIGLLWLVDVFKSFDLTYTMTEGGSANVSKTLNLFAYETVFSYYKFSLSSTMLTILLVIVLLFSVLVMKIQRRLVAYYSG